MTERKMARLLPEDVGGQAEAVMRFVRTRSSVTVRRGSRVSSLREDRKGTDMPTQSELARQMMTDIMRAANAAGEGMAIDKIGNVTVARAKFGTREYGDADDSHLIDVEVEVTPARIRFSVNGQRACECSVDLVGYPECQQTVVQAIQAATIQATDARRSDTPNYGMMATSRIGGSY